MWYVYLLRCSDNSLYTGITTNPVRRLRQHNLGRGGAYTRSRPPVQLVLQEGHVTRSSALKREIEIKRLSRSEKEKLLPPKEQ